MDNEKAHVLAAALGPLAELVETALRDVLGEPCAFSLCVYGTANDQFMCAASNVKPLENLEKLREMLEIMRHFHENGGAELLEAAGAKKH